MKLCIRNDVLEEIQKGLGHKYTKREWKNDHWEYWYGNEKGHSAGGKDETTKQKGGSGGLKIGDIVSFVSHGGDGDKILAGKIERGEGDVAVISGMGEAKGIQYTVHTSDIKEKKANGDGTIPAKSFNANDYKKSFTDPKCTNNADGVKHVYELLGESGRETQAVVEKRLNEQTHRMKNGDTQIRNMHNIVYDKNGKFKSGEWNDERIKLHDKIIAKILSPEKIAACKPKNGEKPKFIMFGGRGGSGKSWFTDKKRAAAEGRQVMFDSDNFLVLDADELKKEIPEFEGWNAGEVHEESSYLNKQIKAVALELGLNIIIDGTMNYNPDKPDKVKNEILAAKEKGYRTEAHYMFLPLQESCKRAMGRFRSKKGDYSGRLVPTDVLLGMQDNEMSFDSVKDIVDDWSFRDNQGSSGPKLVSRKGMK